MQEGRLSGGGGRAWGDVVKSHGMLGAPRRQERKGRIFPQSLQQEHDPPGCSPHLSKVLVDYQFLSLSDKKLKHDEIGFLFCCSISPSCPTLCDPMGCSTPGSSILHYLLSLLKLMSIESVMPSSHLILCCPLLLPSIFPSITIFSSASVLRIRWSKYGASASTSVLPMNIQG